METWPQIRKLLKFYKVYSFGFLFGSLISDRMLKVQNYRSNMTDANLKFVLKFYKIVCIVVARNTNFKYDAERLKFKMVNSKWREQTSTFYEIFVKLYLWMFYGSPISYVMSKTLNNSNLFHF